MAMNLKPLLHKLELRLPELEWKIRSLNNVLQINTLPRGLFRTCANVHSHCFIAEIKEDLHVLAIQKQLSTASYLAKRIHQKITVLVTICNLQVKKPQAKEKVSFNLQKINTRQQWRQSLEQEIEWLTKQHMAMLQTFQQKQLSGNTNAQLMLQSELGEIARRLTLAKETLAQI